MLKLEQRTESLLPRVEFVRRIGKACIYAFASMGCWLALGTAGFHYLENMSCFNAFCESIIMYSGIGSVQVMQTPEGKLFHALYALFSTFALLIPITIIIGPILHRFLHKFHLDDE